MKILIQRVLSASVHISNQEYSSIKNGLLLYICFEQEDTQEIVDKSIKKITSLRIFEDEQRRMNLNINQKKEDILLVSQFTLSWSGVKGNRPSFERSMAPLKAKEMYSYYFLKLKDHLNGDLKDGQFGADMKIQSINDGPVTFFLSF